MNDNITGGVSPLKKKLLISGGSSYKGGTKYKSKGTKGKRGGGFGKSTATHNVPGYTKTTRFRIPDKKTFPSPSGGTTKPTTPTPPFSVGPGGQPVFNLDFADMFGDFNLSNTMGSMTMGSMNMGDMSNAVSNDNKNINTNENKLENTVENKEEVQQPWNEYKEDPSKTVETTTEGFESYENFWDRRIESSENWSAGMKTYINRWKKKNPNKEPDLSRGGEIYAEWERVSKKYESQRNKGKKGGKRTTRTTTGGQKWKRNCNKDGCGKWYKI